MLYTLTIIELEHRIILSNSHTFCCSVIIIYNVCMFYSYHFFPIMIVMPRFTLWVYRRSCVGWDFSLYMRVVSLLCVMRPYTLSLCMCHCLQIQFLQHTNFSMLLRIHFAHLPSQLHAMYFRCASHLFQKKNWISLLRGISARLSPPFQLWR